MNVKLLRKVQKHIKDHPESLNMEHWFSNECGTVACIAGHVCKLSGYNPVYNNYVRKVGHGNMGGYVRGTAASELKLSGFSDGDHLFFVSSWPVEFRKAYLKCRSAKARATVVVKRIDHFIKTNGDE